MSSFCKNYKGFTLIEVLITMAIFTVIIEAIYVTVVVSQRSLNGYARTTAPKQGLRAALAAMTRELRGATNPFIIKEDHNITMTFQHPQFGNVKYTWTDTGDDADKIIRTIDSNKTVLAYNITSLLFTLPFSNNQIIIEIGDGDTTNGTALQLKEEVALRLQTNIF